MVRTMMIVVGDDQVQCEKMKAFGQGNGCTVEVYTSAEWAQKSKGEVTSLSIGMQPVQEGAKILQFPQPNATSMDDKKVRTINELESLAIENAIHEYGGNLTEAAKALGIGRATLYRKVKQYNIDPSSARRKQRQAA